MQGEQDFRRGERIDNFVDAAFAFATTLLVISVGDPPSSLEELRAALVRTPAFAAGFALIALFWWAHHTYAALRARRDGLSLLLSLAIVFVILVYVYPLRLLIESALGFMSGGLLPGAEFVRSASDLRLLYEVYAAGFVALAALYAALYGHAASNLRRDGESERATQASDAAGSYVILGASGVISAGLAAVVPIGDGPGFLSAIPGLVYALIGPAMGLYYGVWLPRRERTGAQPPEPRPPA